MMLEGFGRLDQPLRELDEALQLTDRQGRRRAVVHQAAAPLLDQRAQMTGGDAAEGTLRQRLQEITIAPHFGQFDQVRKGQWYTKRSLALEQAGDLRLAPGLGDVGIFIKRIDVAA